MNKQQYPKGACSVCGRTVGLHRGKATIHPAGPGRSGPCSGSRRGAVSKSTRPIRSTARSLQALKPIVRARMPRNVPLWFPEWQGLSSMPSIALPAGQERMGVWIPERRRLTPQIINEILAVRVRLGWDDGLGCWMVSRGHFTALAEGLLRRYPCVAVAREFNRAEMCTPSCKNASGPYCTCSCQARNHGGGGWMAGWRTTSGPARDVEGFWWTWLLAEKAGQAAYTGAATQRRAQART